MVCPSEAVPGNVVEEEAGWRGFRIQGVLDFSLVGILSKIAALLADHHISIFAISTYKTDYIWTKKEAFIRAMTVLEEAGFVIEK